jgi:hypothetical protein
MFRTHVYEISRLGPGKASLDQVIARKLGMDQGQNPAMR